MRDHVVQLARDPRPLAVGRRRGALLALGVESLGALAVGALARAALAQHAPDRPRRASSRKIAGEDDFRELPVVAISASAPIATATRPPSASHARRSAKNAPAP